MKTNYEYTTHALVVKKEINDLKITITAELPKNVNFDDALDVVLDVLLDMAEQMPVDNDKGEELPMIPDYMSPVFSTGDPDDEGLLRLDLVSLMKELSRRNKNLPDDKRLPLSFFAVYSRSIERWHEMTYKNMIPLKVLFSIWKNNQGFNDLTYLKRLSLSEEEQTIIERYKSWAKKTELSVMARTKPARLIN